VLEIHRAAKSFTENARERMKQSYRGLMRLTRDLVRTAETVVDRLKSGELPVPGNLLRVLRNEAQLRHFTPLVRRVLAQTQARVFEGNTHFEGKTLIVRGAHSGHQQGQGQ